MLNKKYLILSKTRLQLNVYWKLFLKKSVFFLLLKQRKMNSVERSSFVHSKEGNDAGTCLSKKDQRFTYFDPDI